MKKADQLSTAYLQWIIRLIALCPLYLMVTGVRLDMKPELPFLSRYSDRMNLFFQMYSDLIYVLAFFLIFVLVILPFRTLWYAKMSGSHEKTAWKRRLRYSFLRLIRGTVWGIPFLGGAFFLIYGFNGMDFKSFFTPIQTLGSFVSKDSSTIDKGLILYFILLLLFGAVYAFGWWLDTQSDFLLGSEGRFFLRGTELRRKYRNLFAKQAAVQILLWIPAAVLYNLIFILYLLKNLSLSNGIFAAINSLNVLLKTPLPPVVFAELAAVLLLVHIPTYWLRKRRMAGIISWLEEKESHAA